MKINIHKPFTDGTVGIYDRKVEQAIKRKETIELETPTGTYLVDPVKWKKTSAKMFRHFKLDKPMLLYVNSPSKFQDNDRIEISEDGRQAMLQAWRQLQK